MASTDPAVVRIDINHTRDVNFAQQQNHAPVVRSIRFTNGTNQHLKNLTVSVTTTPPFTVPFETVLADLAPGAVVDLTPVDLQLDVARLACQLERESGTLNVALADGDSPVATATSKISILAHDEWGGSLVLPELIAAFVTPRHPSITALIRKASDILKSWNADPSLEGYQSKDPRRVRQLVAAIYAVIKDCDIAYCVPPASFEENGQKIRTADQVLETRLGTCIDLTVLFASCLEAIGLHPLIIMVSEHAFVGSWLIDETFSESVQDDVTLLTKRVAAGVQEVCVLETTALTAGKNTSFEQALALAEARLLEKDKFHFFVDVKRARNSRIRPLPSRVNGKPVEDEDGDGVPDEAWHQAPEEIDAPIPFVETDDDEGPGSRLDRWERRLLDLSLHNPLLNFRAGTAGLRILTADVGSLEDAIADGTDFEIHPRPQDWTATPREAGVFVHRTHSDPERLLLEDEFTNRRLRADVTQSELATRLTLLYRSARTAMEENGANTMFLAVGMLAWHPAEDPRTKLAPLVLIPVELVRKSVRTGYVLRRRDDEPIFNITLLEMLRQDMGIEVHDLDTLPRDAHGVDIKAVLTVIRRAVMNISGWDVVEAASLGIFSFNKFVMWHDLRTREKDLEKSPVVRALMTGSIDFSQVRAVSTGPDLDEACQASEILCPVSADSSQLEAICAIDRGGDMVLHGPPGTGKSQTITNLIANALGKNKTVLFVAEKMAALSVVQRRLEKIGLGNFCLELHSNKSRKADVIAQLGNALNAGIAASPEGWKVEAARLVSLKKELNSYVDALHIRRRIGHSVFDGLAKLSSVSSAPDQVRFSEAEVAALTPEGIETWTALAHRLGVAARECGSIWDSPWTGCRKQEYSPNMRGRIAESIGRLRREAREWIDSTAPLTPLFTLADGKADFETLSGHVDLMALLMEPVNVPSSMLTAHDWKATSAALRDLIKTGLARNELRESVLSRYSEDVLEIEAAALIRELRALSQRWALPRWSGRRRIKAQLRSYLADDAEMTGDLESELGEIRQLRDLELAVRQSAATAERLLGPMWKKGNPDFQEIAAVTGHANAVLDQLGKISQGNQDIFADLKAQTATFFANRETGAGPNNRQMGIFVTAGRAAIASFDDLCAQIALERQVVEKMTSTRAWLAGVEHWLGRLETALDDLRTWCAWNRVRQEAVDAGLTTLVSACEAEGMDLARIEQSFIKGLYSVWSEFEIVNDPVLSTFSRGLFEDRIRQFRELDDRYALLTCQEIYARLASLLPRPAGEPAQNSEIGVLKREMQKQRAHLALRVLFQRIPNILPRLKPCLLMSPISVAQYLDPSHPPFDLIIIDEASQVPTCDAVGAISRARQVVVVGDPKQLPPTTFFTRGDTDEEDDAAVATDLESILDDCLAISMPQKHLLWHYRSRHESLIAFSNMKYYENRLLTFPSPDDLTPKVRMVLVEGRYDRGASKQNRVEAQAVVNEIIRRLRDARESKFSIGVVTFSQPQQKLIEDLLDDQLRKTPQLEKYFTDGLADQKEPVFVKNLENVQGDERDVILFSVGYGPDQTGRVSMNFGPVNKQGGWRRLNVAVSRARHEMVVFSSIRSTQLDTSRSSARGVADLKAFLEYAEIGRLPGTAVRGGDNVTPVNTMFEESVRSALIQKGHKVNVSIGTSAYRVDLGIVDPANPGRYIIGIMCDGPTYRGAKTVRDRDKLREAVLGDLGWNLHHVWSTDWWANTPGEIDRIEKAIADARNPGPAAGDSKEPAAGPTTFVPPPPMTEPPAAKMAAMLTVEHPVYQPHRLISMAADPEVFYESRSIPTIASQIMEVVDAEGPVSHDLVARRVTVAWGMTKVGSRIDDRIRSICKMMKLSSTRHGESVWYWPMSKAPGDCTGYRVPGTDIDSRREPADIPPEEAANAAIEVLEGQISLPRQDLVREIARRLGFQRLGTNVESCFGNAIDLVVNRGLAEVDAAGRVVWISRK